MRKWAPQYKNVEISKSSEEKVESEEKLKDRTPHMCENRKANVSFAAFKVLIVATSSFCQRVV